MGFREILGLIIVRFFDYFFKINKDFFDVGK